MDNQKDINQEVIIPTTQKPKSNFLIVALILVGLLLTISFLYFGYQLSSSRKEKPIPPPAPLKSPKAITDETASWKTYTSKKYQYSLNYPPDYSVLETSPEYTQIFKETSDTTGIETYLSIQVKENPKKLTLTEWEKENVDVANYAPYPPGVKYLQGKDGTIFQITPIIMDIKNKSETQTIFDQILSTFKFYLFIQ